MDTSTRCSSSSADAPGLDSGTALRVRRSGRARPLYPGISSAPVRLRNYRERLVDVIAYLDARRVLV